MYLCMYVFILKHSQFMVIFHRHNNLEMLLKVISGTLKRKKFFSTNSQYILFDYIVNKIRITALTVSN